MPVALAAIQGCTFFQDVAVEVVQSAAKEMVLHHLRRREVLGGSAGFAGLGVVLSGTIQAVDATADGREVAMLTVGVNEVFGVAELLAARAMPLLWIAGVSGTAVALLAATPALGLLAQPSVALQAAKMLALQVCDAQGWQKVRAMHPISTRVAAWINWQAASDGALRVPTHAELAWQLNTTRESVTRVFQRLMAEGVLSRDGEGWRLANSAALADWLAGKSKGVA